MPAALPAARLPIVGVMGSGRDRHDALAGPLGRWIAARGGHLLTGGGGGVMTAVAEAFVAVTPRAGLSLGVLPGVVDGAVPRPPAGYPNPFVELPIATHLPHSGERGTEPTSRNHVNVLTATVVIALPGAAGTRSEVELALRYGRPVILHGPEAAFEGFPEAAPRAAALAAVRSWAEPRLSG